MTDEGPGALGPSQPADAPSPPEGPPPSGPEPAGGRGDLVAVDVEARFPEIGRVKATGTLFFVLTGVAALAPVFLQGEGFSLGTRSMLALVLASAGTAMGVAGLYAPSLRRMALLVAPVVLASAAAAGTLGASLDTIPPLELLLAFVFGASWLLAVEHLHALTRFVELGAYVTRQRLDSFSLGGVVNHFQVYGVGLVAIIGVVTAVVVVGVPWVFSKGTSGVFSRSVELNSVFGVAMAAAVVFTLSALILVFVRSVVPQRVDVERVAYSRDRMDDMLRSSQLIESGGEEGR